MTLIGLLRGPLAAAETDFSCPAGAVERGRPTADGTERWCELPGSPAKRHGPWWRVDDRGRVVQEGTYSNGNRHGTFVTRGEDGEVLEQEDYWHDVPGRVVDDPNGVCPAGAVLVRQPQKERAPLHVHETCFVLDEQGNPRNEGLSSCYEVNDEGEVFLQWAYPYRDGVMDGVGRRWRPDGTPELEETYVADRKTGRTRSWYESGALREEMEFAESRPDGERVFFNPDGTERWRAVYEAAVFVSLEGELDLEGDACPEKTAPVTAADERSAWCEMYSGYEPVREGPFIEWTEGGDVAERGRYHVGRKVEITERRANGAEFREDAGALAARIAVLFDGEPLANVSGVEPDFWFSFAPSGVRTAATTEWDGFEGGAYGLTAGHYRVTAAVDEERNQWGYPGDFEGSSSFEVSPDGVAEVTVEVEQIMHLLAPIDNEVALDNEVKIGEGGIPEGVCEGPIVPRDATFAWEPMGRDAEYEYRLERVQCFPYRVLDVVAEGVTIEPEITLELPPSAPGEIYSFALEAKRDSRGIGHLIVHSGRGYGWSLRFRVAD